MTLSELTEDDVFHCRNEEEFNALVEFLDSESLTTWRGNKWGGYQRYCKDICFRPLAGCVDSLQYYVTNGYKIHPAEDLLKNYQSLINEFLNN
jgi:hypothetical protein